MTNLELAKYWYYRIIDKYSKDNFEKNSKLGQQKNELEIYIKNNDNYFKEQLDIIEGVSLRLQAALHYGRDLENNIQYLKNNEYKRIWNKEPGGLSYKEWLDQEAKTLSDSELLKIVRIRMKDYIYHNDDVDIVINSLSKEKKELVYIVPTIEQFSKAYYFYYKHKDDDGSAKTELDNYENLIKLMEPLIVEEFEKFLLLIGIDYDKLHLINPQIESDYFKTNEKKDKLINTSQHLKESNAEAVVRTNIIKNMHKTNRQLRMQIDYLKKYRSGNLTDSEIERIVDSCRKKNGKINYTAVGKIIGLSKDTIRNLIIKRKLTWIIDKPNNFTP